MYNLKQVSTIIGFESKLIKILIVDNTTSNIHCLYSNSIQYSGFDQNNLFNIDEVKKVLRSELIKAEKFIGAKISGWFLDIPNLQIGVETKIIDNKNFSNEIDLQSYIDNLPPANNTYTLRNVITKYIVNDQVKEQFPNRAKNFKIEYVSYYASNSIITLCSTLCNDLGIEIFGFYNNAFAIKSLFNKENRSKLLIDVCDDGINLTCYGLNNIINRSIKINYGIDWLKNPIRRKLLIDDNNKIDNLINIIPLIKNVKVNPVIVNHHQDTYLAIAQCSISNLFKLVNKSIIEQFDRISSQFQEHHFSEVILTCCNKFHDVYKLINDISPIKINGTAIKFLENNVIGLENENNSYLLSAINDALVENNSLDSDQKCSIDPFILEDISSKQYQQKVIIKLGIISTNFAAKLGQGE